jgi:hypothetical protein
LKEQETSADSLHWSELVDKVYELNKRLRILDLRAYSDPYGNWFPALEAYVDAVLKLVIADGEFSETYSLPAGTPNASTRAQLRELHVRHDPTQIRLDIKTAIRMELFGFKEKWDATLKTA